MFGERYYLIWATLSLVGFLPQCSLGSRRPATLLAVAKL